MTPSNSVSSIHLSLKSQRFSHANSLVENPLETRLAFANTLRPNSLQRSSQRLSPLNDSRSQEVMEQTLTTARNRKPTRLAFNRVIRGALKRDDSFERSLKSYVDDYRLRRLPVGQPIEVRLRSRSRKLTPNLQLIDGRTDRVLLTDTPLSRRAVRLVFTPEAGGRYFLRVSNDRPRRTGKYTLRTAALPVAPPAATPSPPAPNFNTLYGYGLVDAAAAVARVVGQAPFADVSFQDVALNDSRYPNTSYLWGVDRVKAPEVWARGYTGQGVTVAVIDTGVGYDHPDLRNNIWVNPNEIAGNGIDDDRNGFVDDVRGWDFVNNDNAPLDSAFGRDAGHGTLVSGVIAANNVSATDIAGRRLGVAPDAKIMPIRALSSLSFRGNSDKVAAGIRYAVNNGADVINLSLGFDDGGQAISVPDPTIEAALIAARRAGVVVVLAAGNGRRAGAIRPAEPAFAASRNLGIAVGAIDRSGRVADFSNPAGNRPLDYVVAPGVDIFSTYYQPTSFFQRNTYALTSGTSFAAPYVAGVAALMLSANRSLTPDQIESTLIATANRGVTT
jgi:subtilisin